MAGTADGNLAARLRQRVASGHERLQAEELKAHAASVRATPIADSPDRQPTVAAGTLRAVTVRPRGNSPALQADLWDGTGSLTLVWLGRRDIPGVEPGRKIVVRGRVAQIRGARTMFNPTYELGPPSGSDPAGSATVNR